MVSTRCPACGAKNPGDAVKCRICGQDLRGLVEAPLSQPVPGSALHRDGRLGSLVAIVAGGVVLVVALAVLIGAVPGNSATNWIRDRVPFLSQKTDDGWQKFSEASGPWAAELPANRAQTTLPTPWTTDGTSQAWVSDLGSTQNPDTQLVIEWGTVPTPAGEDVEASLASVAQRWAQSMGGTVTADAQSSFAGFPARRVTVTGMKSPTGDDVTVEAALIRHRDELVMIWSRSIYPNHPEFGRLVSGFTFL